MDEVQYPQDTMDWNFSFFAECPEAPVPGDNDTIPVMRSIEEQGQIRRLGFPILRTDTKYLCDIRIRKRNNNKTGPDECVRVYRLPFGENKVCCASGQGGFPQDIQHVSIEERKKCHWN